MLLVNDFVDKNNITMVYSRKAFSVGLGVLLQCLPSVVVQNSSYILHALLA